MFPHPVWTLEVDWDDDGAYDAVNEAVNLVGLHVRRGRDFFIKADGKGFERFTVGTATLTLNNPEGRYSALNAASPLYPNAKPGRYARIRVDNGTTVQDVLTGRIADIRPTGDMLSPQVQMILEDGWTWLRERAARIAVQESIGTATAIGMVLDNAEWPALWGDDLSGSADTIPYWWADQRQADEEIQDLAESELGLFTIAADGKGKFRGRHAIDDIVLTIHQADVQREVGLPQPWEVVRGEVKLTVYPRTRQATGELWRLQDQPYIEAGGKLTLVAPYSYDNQEVPALGIQQPEPTLDYTLAGMSSQSADLEEGDTSDFDSVATSGGATLVASAMAALRGNYGAAVTPAGAGTYAMGRLTGALDEGLFATGMLLDPHSLTMADGDSFTVLAVYMDVAVGGTTWVASVQLKRSSGQYTLQARYASDAGSWTYLTAVAIDDGPHSLALIHEAASSAGANDGEVRFYVDGLLVGSATGIDNDQRLPDAVQFGAFEGVDAGTSGTFYVDECWWCDVAVEPTPYGLTAQLEVTNGTGAGGALTFLRLRGDALTALNPAILEALAASDVRSVFEHDLPWQQNTNTGRDLADLMASLLSTSQLYPMVSMVGRPDLQFAVDLLDRIQLVLPDYGIDDEYRVGMIEHEWLDRAGMTVRTTLRSEFAITVDGYWMFPTQVGVTSIFGV